MGILNIENDANNGNVEALVKLGRIYLEGMGVEPDYKKAHNYFVKAAKEQNGAAYSYLAYTYANGLGVEKNDEKVVSYYEKAYELNDVYASLALCIIYRRGLYGQEKNEDKAMEYITRASNAGFGPAKYEYALLLEKQAKKLAKSSDAQDKQKANSINTQALNLYKEAASKNYAPAKYALAIKYIDSNDASKAKEIFTLLDSAKESEAPYVYYALAYAYDFGIGCNIDYAKSFEYYNRAFNAGYKKAAMDIAYAYLLGAGCPQDYKMALDLLRDAVNGGIQEANFYAGMCFEYGLSVDADIEKAIELYGYAEQAEYVPAILKLGQIYDPYYGVGGDADGAKEEYESAAQKGSIDAQAELSKMNFENDKKAEFEKIKKFAEQGSPVALEFLGKLYKDGNGVTQSNQKAIDYFKQAADKGLRFAAQEIVDMATESDDKALLAKYGDTLNGFGAPKEYFARAKELKELGDADRAVYWYAMAGLTTKKQENVERAENAIKDTFKKDNNGKWSLK